MRFKKSFFAVLFVVLASGVATHASYFGELLAPSNNILMGPNGSTGTMTMTTPTNAMTRLGPWTTKGDLVIYNGAAAVRFPKCADTETIEWDSAQALGAKCSPLSSGSVTSISVATANGFAGSSSGGATPALTLTTSLTSNVVKANGTALIASVAGTDYQAPISTSTAGANQFTNGFTAPNTFTYAQPAFSNLSGQPTVAQSTFATSAMGALNVDWSLSNSFSKTLSAGANAITFSNKASGETILVRLTCGGVACSTTWPAVTWLSNGGSSPAVPAVSSDAIITLFYDGATVYGSDGSSSTSGTVTTVSVVSANGLAGTVANPTTTPAITLSTSITGVLKGNGTAISAAASGTDYQAPISSDAGAANNFLTSFTAPNTFGKARPTCANLSDSTASCSTDATNASNISSGTLAVARSTVATSAMGASNIDWSLSNAFTKTLGANLTVTFSNQISGQTIVVRLTNTASNYTVTWPGGVLWSGGTPPTQTIGAFSDVYTFFYDGSTTYGSVVQNF